MPGSAHTICAPVRKRPESGQACPPQITPLHGRTGSASRPSPLPGHLPTSDGPRSNTHAETRMAAERQQDVAPYRRRDVQSPSEGLLADCPVRGPVARASSSGLRPSILFRLLPRRIGSNLCERRGPGPLHAHLTTVPAQTHGWFPALSNAARPQFPFDAGGFCSLEIREYLSKLENLLQIEPH